MSSKSEFQYPILLGAASLVVVIAGLKIAAPLIAQFLMALFIAVVCMPSIRWMESHRIPRFLAIIVVLSVVLGFVYLVVALVGDSIQSFGANKAEYAEKLQANLQSANSWLGSMGIPESTIDFASLFEKADVMSLVSRVVGGLGVIFSDFFVIFLSVIFILSEAASFPQKFKSAFSDSREKMVHVDEILGKFDIILR